MKGKDKKRKIRNESLVWNDEFVELGNYLSDSASNVRELANALGYADVSNIDDATTLLEQDIRQATGANTTAQIDDRGIFMKRIFTSDGSYLTERSIRIYFPLNIRLFVKVVQAFRDDCMYVECAINDARWINE